MLFRRNIGRIIREHRDKLGMTLETLAGLCDLSVTGLNKIELGDSDPKMSTIFKISEVLKLNLGDFNDCIYAEYAV